MMLRKIRIALWALVGIAAVAGLWVALRPQSQPPIVTGPSVADIGGPFTLTGADGKPFASSSLAGKPYAIFFGFTHCPDVCPTTLARLARLRTSAPARSLRTSARTAGDRPQLGDLAPRLRPRIALAAGRISWSKARGCSHPSRTGSADPRQSTFRR